MQGLRVAKVKQLAKMGRFDIYFDGATVALTSRPSLVLAIKGFLQPLEHHSS